MSFRVPCPGCGTSYSLPDEIRGKKLRCKKCSRVFAATAATAAPPVPDEPEKVRPVDEHDLPATARGGDRPARRAAPRPRPAGPPPAAAGPVWPWIVGGAVVGLLLLAGVGTPVIFYMNRQAVPPPVAAANPAPAAPTPPAQPAASTPAPEPAAAAAADAPADQLPAGLTDKVVVPLPSAVTDVAVGGGGRYLVLSMPAERKLVVFDVKDGRVVRLLPMASENVKFAAGRDKVVAVFSDEKMVERWDLATGQREARATTNLRGVVTAVGMGSASDGPFLVTGLDSSRGEQTFFDLRTLQPLSLSRTGYWGLHTAERTQIRASPDGRVFALMCPAGSWGIQVMVVEGNSVRQYYDGVPSGVAIPDADGRLIYAAGGARNERLKPVGAPAAHPDQVGAVPAYGGPFYLEPFGMSPAFGRPQPGEKPAKPSLALHLRGESQPLLTLTDPEGLDPGGHLDLAGAAKGTPLTFDRRVHLVPEFHRLVIIPPAGDRLILYRLDPEEVLEKSGVDYLLVTSRPPGSARKGTPFTYQMAGRAKRGPMKYTLAAGPPGMTVSSDGLLRWDVPADLTGGEVAVTVTAADSTGREVFHTFQLPLTGDATGQTVAAGPARASAPAPVPSVPALPPQGRKSAPPDTGALHIRVTAKPPPPVRKGKSFVYRLTVDADRGPLRYRVKSGPPGLTLKSTNLVVWPVPADFEGNEAEAAIVIRDAAGREITHTLRIPVADATGPLPSPSGS